MCPRWIARVTPVDHLRSRRSCIRAPSRCEAASTPSAIVSSRAVTLGSMPTLVLVRHARAAHSYPDHTRPLTRAGVDQASAVVLSRQIGSFACGRVLGRGSRPDVRLDQPARVGPREAGSTAASTTPTRILTLARTFEGERALIVGHEPTISGAGYVLAREERSRQRWPGHCPPRPLILTFDGSWEDGPSSCACVRCSPPTR